MLSYVGDEKALCQLVEILIDNALKYSREGDTVHLTLERQGRFIRMAVEKRRGKYGQRRGGQHV